MGWEYVIPGYAIVVIALGSFALATIRRGRELSKQVPPGKQRFLDE
jgi:hypothetical protein